MSQAILANGSAAFKWKLYYHWLISLRQNPIEYFHNTIPQIVPTKLSSIPLLLANSSGIEAIITFVIHESWLPQNGTLENNIF